MGWKQVRLELSRSEKFPNGSPGRAMIMHVPLDDQGMIDRAELRRASHAASVRRYWGSEPDQFGQVDCCPDRCILRFLNGEELEILHLDQVPFRLNQSILIRGADGPATQFQIVALHDLAIGRASHR